MRPLALAAAALLLGPATAFAQDMGGMSHHAGHNPPPPSTGQTALTACDEPGAICDAIVNPAVRPYSAGSGTSWVPGTSPGMAGVMTMTGPWMVMTEATLNLVYDRQSGPRGADKTFVSGMVMSMASREVGEGGSLRFSAMLSPDPFMGNRGYPLLLATGETADGHEPLVDRQHPHDLFMELSASYAQNIAQNAGVFVYAGLPGEPAFGPPAFMHRQSIMDSPEAPIAHHWLDSTHITFGVVTAGFVVDRFKLEASRFNGREPDQHRYDIETGPLSSTAVRFSWNPTPEWALQASWARVIGPEQLEPDVDQTRWSASAIYTRRLENGWWSSTLAWGRRTAEGRSLDAWSLESAVRRGPWTVFGRGEAVRNDELIGHHGGPAYDVGKISVGAIHDWRLDDHVSIGLGGLYAINFVPSELQPVYGDSPQGAMAFVRLRID